MKTIVRLYRSAWLKNGFVMAAGTLLLFTEIRISAVKPKVKVRK
jgi:hypothetical protein